MNLYSLGYYLKLDIFAWLDAVVYSMFVFAQKDFVTSLSMCPVGCVHTTVTYKNSWCIIAIVATPLGIIDAITASTTAQASINS